MATDEPAMLDILRLQAAACTTMGSPLYGDLLTGLAADYEAGGLSYDLLHDRPRPWHDAVHLRMLGATPRLALSGASPQLAAHYPSCGGSPGPTLFADHMATLEHHRSYVEEQLGAQVQTNRSGAPPCW